MTLVMLESDFDYESAPLESIIEVEEPKFESTIKVEGHFENNVASEENPIILVADALQPVSMDSSIESPQSVSMTEKLSTPENNRSDYVYCRICLTFFDNEPLLETHLKFCDKINEKFVCACCGYKTAEKCHYKRHLQTLKHRLMSRSKSSSAATVESTHNRREPEEFLKPMTRPQDKTSNKVTCEVCLLRFQNQLVFASHWREEHQRVHGNHSDFVDSAKKAQRITRSVYNHSSSHCCNVCRKIFSTKISLSKHKEIHYSRSSNSSNDENTSDSEPEPLSKAKLFAVRKVRKFSEADSDDDLLAATEARDFSCRTCVFTFSRKSHLLRHMRTKTHIAKEIARMRPANVRETHESSHCCQINLLTPILNFHGTANILNSHRLIVNRQGIRSNDMKLEERRVNPPITKQKTSESKPFEVTTCSCCYKQVNVRLRRLHMLQKHRKSNYQCQECSATLNYYEHLRMHILNTHYRGPLKRCHCGAAYKNDRSLRRHQQQSHAPPIICYICRRIFNVRSSLRSHWRNRHSGNYGSLQDYKKHMEANA